MSEEVDDFLAHYGVKGMQWGRRQANDSENDSPRSKMSKKKKIAIAVGVGATVAIGAAIAISVLNSKKMDIPVNSLTTNPSTSKGKSNLVISEPTRPQPKPQSVSVPKKPEPNILENRLNRAGLSPSDLNRIRPNTQVSRPSGPDLNVLSDIMNGGPHVSYNSKTGRYETK